jgi:hypothetical protein
MHKRTIAPRLQNHCCRAKALRISYFCVCARALVGECILVYCVGVDAEARACACARAALLIQQATRIRHIVCGLSDSPTFFDIIS